MRLEDAIAKKTANFPNPDESKLPFRVLKEIDALDVLTKRRRSLQQASRRHYKRQLRGAGKGMNWHCSDGFLIGFQVLVIGYRDSVANIHDSLEKFHKRIVLPLCYLENWFTFGSMIDHTTLSFTSYIYAKHLTYNVNPILDSNI